MVEKETRVSKDRWGRPLVPTFCDLGHGEQQYARGTAAWQYRRVVLFWKRLDGQLRNLTVGVPDEGTGLFGAC